MKIRLWLHPLRDTSWDINPFRFAIVRELNPLFAAFQKVYNPADDLIAEI
jgi:hypothetical protein